MDPVVFCYLHLLFLSLCQCQCSQPVYTGCYHAGFQHFLLVYIFFGPSCFLLSASSLPVSLSVPVFPTRIYRLLPRRLPTLPFSLLWYCFSLDPVVFCYLHFLFLSLCQCQCSQPVYTGCYHAGFQHFLLVYIFFGPSCFLLSAFSLPVSLSVPVFPTRIYRLLPRRLPILPFSLHILWTQLFSAICIFSSCLSVSASVPNPYIQAATMQASNTSF